MSGFARNLLAYLIGLSGHASRAATDVTMRRFWVTPFDCGLRVLKSDKYLQLVEAAQVDYLLKIGKLHALLRSGVAFVNVSQLVTFARSIPVFSRVCIETRLIYADGRSAYFSHSLRTQGSHAAEVLVKMKFKKGRMTVAPSLFLSTSFAVAPTRVKTWSAALEAIGSPAAD